MAYQLQYYDLVLAGIIAAIGLGGLVGAVTWIRMPFAIAGLGAVSIMGHAMFVNGPIDDLDDLAEEVEEGQVSSERLPLVE
jgi:hypothetical protein